MRTVPSSSTNRASSWSDHPAAKAGELFHFQAEICSPLLVKMVTTPLSREMTGPPYCPDTTKEVLPMEKNTPEYSST